MNLKQIIYSSQPFGYDVPTLTGILMDARRCNSRDGITGALVCRSDIFLQLLEGPADMVDATYQRIARDDRHANITQLASGPVETRMFGDWDMLHDPAKSWLWSVEDIANGVLNDASPDDVRAVFATLENKVKAEPPE